MVRTKADFQSVLGCKGRGWWRTRARFSLRLKVAWYRHGSFCRRAAGWQPTRWGALLGASLAASTARAETEAGAATTSTTEPSSTEVRVVGQRRAHAQGFSRAEVRDLPGALDDPMRAIEPLPGVTPTVSGIPYFFVRGAPPGDVGYFFDGVRLPALFHALGGPSVVHPGLVDSVELYPGVYPIDYSGFSGGIVVARAAEPSPIPRGEAVLRATDTSAMIEAPLDAASHLSLAGRYSYANPVLHLFSPEMNVEYWDYQARLDRQLSRATRVALRGFGAHDLLTNEDGRDTRTLYGVDFHRLDARLLHAFERGAISVQALSGWDRSLVRDGDVRVRDRSLSVRVDGSYGLGEGVTFNAGARAAVDDYALDLKRLDDPDEAADYRRLYPSRLDWLGGGYVGLDLALSRVVSVRPGVRLDVYASRGTVAVAVDPRVTAEYRLHPAVTVFTGLGIAHQPPAPVVPAPGLNPALGEGLQTGLQHSYGLRLRLPARVSLEATLYQSALFNLSDVIGQSRARDNDAGLRDETRGTGVSRGVELMLRRSLTQRLGGFLSYTLSKSERYLGRNEVPSAYDRRHVMSAALGYDWGAGIRTGVRGSYYTGIPADVAYVEAARNPPRTSPYFRLDVRAEKRFAWGESGWLSLVLEVVNTTLNREPLRASCSAYVCKERRIGPVTIPNLGLEAGF